MIEMAMENALAIPQSKGGVKNGQCALIRGDAVNIENTVCFFFKNFFF